MFCREDGNNTPAPAQTDTAVPQHRPMCFCYKGSIVDPLDRHFSTLNAQRSTLDGHSTIHNPETAIRSRRARQRTFR